MALARRTIVDQITVCRDGSLAIRFSKQIVDGDKVVAEQYHRGVLTPEDDLDEFMQVINNHLAAMGEEEVSEEEIKRIARIAIS